MRKPSRLLRATAIACVFSQAPFFAQTPANANNRLSFEVASIKVNDPSRNVGVVAGTSHPSPTRHHYVGSLRAFIKQAYGIEDVQVSGGPNWLDRDIYEIDARTSAPASHGQLNLMLQTLLAERFKLAVHESTKLLTVYSLVPAKNGPKVQRSDGIAGISMGRGFLRGTMDFSALAKISRRSWGEPP